MEWTPIEVQCYSGYKGDETPRTLILEGRTLDVADVVDRWYQGGARPEDPVLDYFKVATQDGSSYLLRHDRRSGVWYLGRTEAPQPPPLTP